MLLVSYPGYLVMSNTYTRTLKIMGFRSTIGGMSQQALCLEVSSTLHAHKRAWAILGL